MVSIRKYLPLLLGALILLAACGRPVQGTVPGDGTNTSEPPSGSGTTPGQTQPGQTQPGQTQPGQTQPGETQPGQTQPGQTQPGETQPGQTPPGQTPPGQTPPGQTPPGAPAPRYTLSPGGTATFSMADRTVTASLSPEALSLTGLPGPPQPLSNPFGDQAEAALQPFQVSQEQHLLATLTNGRNLLVWVLAPGQTETKIALALQVDWSAEVVGERVKLSWRRYRDDGGYYIVSEYYQFSPRTRTYEKAPA